MPTQEERLIALEQTTREYRPVLQNFAYELTMVKGLIIDQTGITQELRQDISEIAQELRQNISEIGKRLDQTDTRLDRIETLLTQILARLPKAP
jgi:seryl-tRNA synthetase